MKKRIIESNKIIIKTNVEIRFWVPLISLLISLIIDTLVFKTSNTILIDFPNRAIGIAIMNGINPLLRSAIYIKLILLFIFNFTILYLILSRVDKYIKSSIKYIYIKIEVTILTHLSLFTLFTIVLYVLNRQESYYHLGKFLLYLLFLTFFIILTKVFSYKRKKILLNVLNKYNTVLIMLIIPAILLFIYWVLFNGSFLFSFKCFIFHFILFIVAIVTYIVAPSLKKNNYALTLAFIPVLLIPLSIPISNELQFSLSQSYNISPKVISLIFIISLLIVSVVLYIYVTNKYKGKNRLLLEKRIVKYVYYPVIIFTLLIYKYHSQYIQYGAIDMLHFGEKIVPLQQLINFGKWPFIDIWYAHGLSDLIPQLLYSYFNGYRGLESILWIQLPHILGIILFYFLISQLMSPLFGLLLSLLTPIASISPSFMELGIIPTLILLMVIKKTSTARLIWLWISLIFLSLWTPSLGAAVIPSVVFVLICNYINKRKIQVKPLIYSLLITTTPFLTIYIFLVLYKGNNLFENIMMILQFLKADGLVGGYVSIIKEYSSMAVFQYFVLPLISLVYIIYLVLQVLKGKAQSNNQYMMVFLAVFSLIISVRGLYRHGLIEEYSSYYFVLLAFLLPQLYPKLKPHYSQSLFLIMFLLYLFVFPNFDNNIKTDKWFEFKNWENKESRVMNNKDDFKDIANFMKSSLKPDETFYEFINAPVLYFYTEREVPKYFFLPTMFYATDYTQDYYIKKFSSIIDKVPFVIFKADDWWGGNIDGIPNEVRSYRIAEYIYSNYKPYGYIGKYQIWSKVGYHYQEKILGNVSNTGLCNANDAKCEIENNKQIIINSGKQDPYIWSFAEFSSSVLEGTNNYIKLKINSSTSGRVQMFYRIKGLTDFNEKDSFFVDIVKSKSTETQEIYLPISIDPNKQGIVELRLDPPNDSKFIIEEIGLVREQNNIRPIDSIVQNFELAKLPYIWANYDSKESLVNTEVLQTLLTKETSINENQEVPFSVNKDINKSSGNYLHLQVKSNKDGKAKIQIGSSIITIDLIASDKYEDYLVRISSQWEWMNDSVHTISISSTVPININKVAIKKGD